jgi:hypothetical protein
VVWVEEAAYHKFLCPHFQSQQFNFSEISDVFCQVPMQNIIYVSVSVKLFNICDNNFLPYISCINYLPGFRIYILNLILCVCQLEVIYECFLLHFQVY